MSLFTVTADWDNNAPHLTPDARRELFASIPAYQKDARTKGIPQLGAGVIYPVSEEDILVDPFKIPDHWRRGYGLDVGWNVTCAMFGAYDPDADPHVVYLVDEYYNGGEQPDVHGGAIRSRGSWLPGRIDPAARGRQQADGLKLLTLYRKAIYGGEDLALGVTQLGIAVNAVESGLYTMLMAQQHGTLKVFRTRCPKWLAERRLYRRDEHGRVIKKMDHAMDASRYLVASGLSWWAQKPAPLPADPITDPRFTRGSAAGGGTHNWMAS